MKIKIVRSGDELLLSLPEELVARYQLKEGDELNGEAFAAELKKSGYVASTTHSDTVT